MYFIVDRCLYFWEKPGNKQAFDSSRQRQAAQTARTAASEQDRRRLRRRGRRRPDAGGVSDAGRTGKPCDRPGGVWRYIPIMTRPREIKEDSAKASEVVSLPQTDNQKQTPEQSPEVNTVAAEKQEKTGAGQKTLTVIGVILCVILLPILVINVTLIIRSYTDRDAVPSIGGIFPMIVLTDSMYPVIQSGDLIICRQTDTDTLAVGDVITFFDPAGNGTSIVTHRVIEVTQQDGQRAFRTRGDANNADDRLAVNADKVVGTYWKRIPKAGNVAMFMQTTAGLIVCVVLPLLLLVGIDLMRTRRFEKARKQDTDALMKELEALRAQQNAGKSGES